MSDQPSLAVAFNRALLREAGEHVGTLAEQARERLELATRSYKPSNRLYRDWARLAKLSREILEIANAKRL